MDEFRRDRSPTERAGITPASRMSDRLLAKAATAVIQTAAGISERLGYR